MSDSYRPSFLQSDNASKSTADANKQERNTLSSIDMSRLTSSWLRTVMVFVAEVKSREDHDENVYCFDPFRENPKVPTSNV